MDLNDLSESQQELLHPLLRLKTDVSLDSLVVLRDVFNDISDAYNTFASSIKDAEQKLLICYNIASSGSLTPEACEALLMVRGNTPNVSNIVLSATAEQSGVLNLMQSMLSFLNRIKEEAKQLSNNLDGSIVHPFSSFSNEYLKSFGKDEKRAFRQDISGFIPKLQEFKRSPNYSHSHIKKYVDNVLKAYKELQDCMAYETEINQYTLQEAKQLDPKTVSKAKSRTIRAKLALGNEIRELFVVAPELNEIGSFKHTDVDTLSQLSILSKKQSDSPNKAASVSDQSQFTGNASEYQAMFCTLEMKRLELISNCFQNWMDNHAKYEKGVYSQLEILWKEVVKFYPNTDYQRFESVLTGKPLQVEPTHSRMWILPEPGAIDDYSKLKLNTFSESSTPVELSDYEGDRMSDYDMYQDNKDEMQQTLDSQQIATDLSNTQVSDRCAPNLNSIDNVTIVQMMQSPISASPLLKHSKPSPKSGRKPQSSQQRLSHPTSATNKPQPLEPTSKKPLESDRVSGTKSEAPKSPKVGAMPVKSDKSEKKDESHPAVPEKTDKSTKSTPDSAKKVDSHKKHEHVEKDKNADAPKAPTTHSKHHLEPKAEPKDVQSTSLQPPLTSKPSVTEPKTTSQKDLKEASTSQSVSATKTKTVLQTKEDKDATKAIEKASKPSVKQEPEPKGAKLLKQDLYTQLLQNTQKLETTIENVSKLAGVVAPKEKEPETKVVATAGPNELPKKSEIEDLLSAVRSEKRVSADAFYQFLKSQTGEHGESKDLLESARFRLDNHMLSLFNRCKEKNAGSKFDWLTENVEDIVKLFEDYDTYPFTTDYQNLERFREKTDLNVPMLRYSLFDEYMDDRQWTLFALEVLVLTHRYISSFVNHPSMSQDHGELRDFLLANLGVLDQTLIKFRKTIEAFRNRCGISEFEYSILEVVLKPRDSFTSSSPTMNLHIMDVRYRILLLIDSFSKGEIVINSEKLFVIAEFYHWMYRQLHVVYVSLVQKLSRVINLIPNHSLALFQEWFKCLKSKNPLQDLRHGFKFESDEKVSKMCNEILVEILNALGLVNSLKEFAVLKFTKNSYYEPLDNTKTMLLELLRSMVAVEDLDQNLVDHFATGIQPKPSVRIVTPTPERTAGNKKNKKAVDRNFPREPDLTDEDFIIDLDFYNDDDISVLAELRNRRALCFRQCIPREYKTKPGRFISRKAAHIDLSSNSAWNKYFKERVDPVALSNCWRMEEPVILTITSSLHKYLSCDNIAYSDFPQYFQAIVYTTSFMQTGILPNFNLLRETVPDNNNNNFLNHIPMVAHSILAASSYWFSMIVARDHTKVKEQEKEGAPEDTHADVATEETDEFYKRLRLSLTGIKERLHSMLNSNFKVTENMAKQLYILLQLTTNLQYLPSGLNDINSYLLFDIYKYKTGGVFTTENLLPEYIYHDKSCIELITLKNIRQKSKSVLIQMRSMQLYKPYNKVHFFISQLLNYQVPLTFSLESNEDKWNYSLLTPSIKERTVSSVLYLRFIAATFKNELFRCMCQYSKFISEDALFYILSIFVIMFRILYPRLSENIPNLSLFESDEENGLYNMINVFRFIINKNAILFTNDCIAGTKEINDVSMDENSLFPLIVDDMLQMLRHQCTTSSNIWNGFVQYAEFSSLLSNCAILHLKRRYQSIKVDPAVLMIHMRKLMLFQREVDASYIVRAPVSDPALQEQRLLNCMFFTYKNSNHRLSGHVEFIKMIKDNLMTALEHKFVGITEMVDSAIKNEKWESISSDVLYTSGAVDLITVLKYSIKASFDLAPPVEWLILPFTNACESSLRSYYRGISNYYGLKALYNIHYYLVEDEPELFEEESAISTLKKDEMANEDEPDKKKRNLWRRLKRTIGGKVLKTPTHAHFLSYLDTYNKSFENKSVVEDLARVASLEYVSKQIVKIPEDMFGFYYSQLRERDQEYEFLHRAIGTSMISDTNKFFFLEPHQLLELPHSKSLSSLIFASQRILQRDSNQCVLDVITIVMWKIVFVDFRVNIFHNLYTPDIMEGYKIQNIVEKFPQSVYLFVERLPKDYIQFAYNNFFEAFLKSVFYVIRNMRNKDYKFNKNNVKVLYHDVDSLTRLLDKYSQDNLPLVDCIKTYVMKLS